MKQTRKIIILLAIIFVISVNLYAKETVTFAIGEWAPYTSENVKNGKFAEDIVKEAFANEGVEVVYEYYPWKRSYEYAKNGKVAGTFPWSKTAERENEFVINNKCIFKDEDVYFHLKSKEFVWNSIEDLKGYKLGAVLGYKQVEKYKNAGLEYEAAVNEEINFKKMLRGRVDIFEASKYVGNNVISNTFSSVDKEKFTYDPKPVAENKFYILFGKNETNKKLANIFDKGLKKLIDSGRYQEIENQYF